MYEEPGKERMTKVMDKMYKQVDLHKGVFLPHKSNPIDLVSQNMASTDRSQFDYYHDKLININTKLAEK